MAEKAKTRVKKVVAASAPEVKPVEAKAEPKIEPTVIKAAAPVAEANTATPVAAPVVPTPRPVVPGNQLPPQYQADHI